MTLGVTRGGREKILGRNNKPARFIFHGAKSKPSKASTANLYLLPPTPSKLRATKMATPRRSARDNQPPEEMPPAMRHRKRL